MQTICDSYREYHSILTCASKFVDLSYQTPHLDQEKNLVLTYLCDFDSFNIFDHGISRTLSPPENKMFIRKQHVMLDKVIQSIIHSSFKNFNPSIKQRYWP